VVKGELVSSLDTPLSEMVYEVGRSFYEHLQSLSNNSDGNWPIFINTLARTERRYPQRLSERIASMVQAKSRGLSSLRWSWIHSGIPEN
jgi:hypothetical protein